MPLHFVDRKFFIADAVVYHALGRVVEIAWQLATSEIILCDVKDNC